MIDILDRCFYIDYVDICYRLCYFVTGGDSVCGSSDGLDSCQTCLSESSPSKFHHKRNHYKVGLRFHLFSEISLRDRTILFLLQ